MASLSLLRVLPKFQRHPLDSSVHSFIHPIIIIRCFCFVDGGVGMNYNNFVLSAVQGKFACYLFEKKKTQMTKACPKL